MMINHTLCFANPLSGDSIRICTITIAISSLPQLNRGALACSAHKKACWRNEGFSNTMESGDDLPSRAVSSQVLSACGGLTSVFGMGTGGSLQLLSPEIVCTSQTVCSLAPGPFRGLLSHSAPRILKTAQEKLT